MNKSYLSSIKNIILSSKPSTAIHLLLMVLFVCSFANVASAATYYSRVATGNFNTLGSWSTSPTGTPINATALNNADNFVIQNGNNITVAANRTINSHSLKTN